MISPEEALIEHYVIKQAQGAIVTIKFELRR